MVGRIRRTLTFANVTSVLALTIALGTGGAYAANTVFSTDIVDGEVKNADIGNNQVTSTKIYNGSVTTPDIHADAVDGSKILDAAIANADIANGAVNGAKVLDESLTSSDLATDSVQATEIADNSIDGGEIVNESLGTADLAADSVAASELANNSVATANIVNNSIDSADVAGGQSNGAITLNSGFVATGRCRDFNMSVPGAEVGDAVIFSINSAVPQGILLYGVRVSSADTVLGKACNLSGTTFPQLTDVNVAVITITI